MCSRISSCSKLTMLVAIAGLVDGMTGYAETSISMLTQFEMQTQFPIKAVAMSLGFLFGAVEFIESIGYDGRLAIKRVTGVQNNHDDYEEIAEENKKEGGVHLPKLACLYTWLAVAKNIFNYSFLVMALNTWIYELSGLASPEEVQDHINSGKLIPLNLLGVILAPVIYFLFMLPFFMASATRSAANALLGREEKTCFSCLGIFRQFICKTGVIALTIYRNLPQLLLLSPSALKSLSGHVWGWLVIAFTYLTAFLNLWPTYKTIQSAELPIAKKNLGMEVDEEKPAPFKLSILFKGLWFISLIFEVGFSLNKFFESNTSLSLPVSLLISGALSIFPALMRYIAFVKEDRTPDNSNDVLFSR